MGSWRENRNPRFFLFLLARRIYVRFLFLENLTELDSARAKAIEVAIVRLERESGGGKVEEREKELNRFVGKTHTTSRVSRQVWESGI